MSSDWLSPLALQSSLGLRRQLSVGGGAASALLPFPPAVPAFPWVSKSSWASWAFHTGREGDGVKGKFTPEQPGNKSLVPERWIKVGPEFCTRRRSCWWEREKTQRDMERVSKSISVIISPLLPFSKCVVERNRNNVCSSVWGRGKEKMCRILNADPVPSSFQGRAAAEGLSHRLSGRGRAQPGTPPERLGSHVRVHSRVTC